MSETVDAPRDWEQHFPFAEVRPVQKELLDGIEDAVKQGKRYIIIDAGTGVGKSVVGVTLARWIHSLNQRTDRAPGACFLTTQRILQDQYDKDFGRSKGSMVSLSSAANYDCKMKRGTSCKDALRSLKTADRSSKFFKVCSASCKYKQAKQAFIASTEGVTNFKYYLTETNFSGTIPEKTVMIIDEAHNLVNELSDFVNISVSEAFVDRLLKSKFPEKLSQNSCYAWIRDEYHPQVRQRLIDMTKRLKDLLGDKHDIKEFEKLSSQLDMLEQHSTKIGRFIELYDKDNWVFEHAIGPDGKHRRITFKPIDVAPFAKTMVFSKADTIIMMSATIIDADIFRGELGIQAEESAYFSVPSPFPLANRPCIFSPIGRMVTSDIDATLPKMAKAIDAILEQHKNDKGIIHTHSYKIVNALRVLNKKHPGRLIFHDSTDREKAYEKHRTSNKPTVLISPSMQEGIDLKDDLSRFQVICKIPYPYLGDNVVRKRMNRINGWYEYQTLKTVVQSCGRSIRSEEDFAVTYILDADWEKFAYRVRHMLPDFLTNV